MEKDKRKHEKVCCDDGCFRTATLVRVTQFCGEHYYCEEHARKQPDFGKEPDGQSVWCPVTEKDHNRKPKVYKSVIQLIEEGKI
jgi:hypothetical protein